MVNDPVDLSGQQPRWPTPARRLWQRCAAEAAADGELWRRPARGGDERLRVALARRGGQDPAHLTVVDGVRAVALALADVHHRVVLHTPTFLGVRPQFGSGTTVTFAADLDVRLEPGDLLVLTSPARNPDGDTLDAPARAAAVAHLDAGVRVLVNETYREWHPHAPRVPGAETMSSLHKVAGVGARLGYVESPRFLDDSVPHLAATEPPLVWQRTWALFLERDGLDILTAANVATSAASARAFDAALADTAGNTAPASGPHRLTPLPAGVDEPEALHRLATNGYLAVGGTHFASPAPALRFCFIGVSTEDAAALPPLLDRLGLIAPEPLPTRGGTS